MCVGREKIKIKMYDGVLNSSRNIVQRSEAKRRRMAREQSLYIRLAVGPVDQCAQSRAGRPLVQGNSVDCPIDRSRITIDRSVDRLTWKATSYAFELKYCVCFPSYFLFLLFLRYFSAASIRFLAGCCLARNNVLTNIILCGIHSVSCTVNSEECARTILHFSRKSSHHQGTVFMLFKWRYVI